MRKKIMILVLTMVLTLSSTAFAHAAQPGGGGAGSVNGTESTNGAGSTDRANGVDGALPAGSGENVQTGEPTAAPAPAENETSRQRMKTRKTRSRIQKQATTRKLTLKKKPRRNKYPNTKKDLLLTFAVRIRNSARAGRQAGGLFHQIGQKKTRSTRRS